MMSKQTRSKAKYNKQWDPQSPHLFRAEWLPRVWDPQSPHLFRAEWLPRVLMIINVAVRVRAKSLCNKLLERQRVPTILQGIRRSCIVETVGT